MSLFINLVYNGNRKAERNGARPPAQLDGLRQPSFSRESSCPVEDEITWWKWVLYGTSLNAEDVMFFIMMSLSKRLVYCQFKYKSICIKLYFAVPEKELIMQNGMLQINVYHI